MTFLWIFLPTVLIFYYLLDKRYKNNFLLCASLFFYFWGEPSYILVLLASIAFNYFMGFWIDKSEDKKRKIAVILCIIGNICILGYFKYFNFLIESLNMLAGKQQFVFKHVALPIGISFYTFQALSYVIDLYSKKIKVQKNILNLALYIALFPQLIAGPIVKYQDIEDQLTNREEKKEKFALGIKRFILGLGKKVIISNTLAIASDNIFACNPCEISSALAWAGILCYTLQIYYDFSGYSDMAIGLGKMFGFDFLENFNIPYISQSIGEFWRRWHISLSTWFKNYVYIPLGGNRKGNSITLINLFIVFILTGTWHGAGFTFIVWGMWHGFFIVFERFWFRNILEKNKFKFLNVLYTMFVVVIGWLIFRSDNLQFAINYFKAMFFANSNIIWSFAEIINIHTIIAFVIGFLFCGIFHSIKNKFEEFCVNKLPSWCINFSVLIFYILILLYSTLKLISGTYNPFIYFRF